MDEAVFPASERLRALALHALEEGLEGVAPFLKAMDARGRWLHFGLGEEDPERALTRAEHIINDPEREVEAYAITLDCALEVGGERTEGVRVEAGERGRDGGLVLLQRYVRRAGREPLERLGQPEVWDEQASTRFSPVPVAFLRCGFSQEEWRALYEAPHRAFLCVASAGGEVRPGAREAFERALLEDVDSLSPLVRQVCGEALRQRERNEARAWEEPLALEPLGGLCARVSRRLGLGESRRLKGCLMGVGWRVARASSGVRGWLGGVRPRERQALETLAVALGLPSADAGR
jgi:hypothetical protein